MLTKFKNFFNFLKCKVFQYFAFGFSFSRLVRILFKVQKFGIIWMVAILLPYLFYGLSLLGRQIGPEDFKGFQMPVNVGKMQEFAKIVAASEVPDVSIMSQKSDFGQKSISEDDGGFVERGDTVKFEGISIPNPGAKEHTNDCKTARNECYFVGTKVQFWIALISGGIFGLVVGKVIIQVFFYLKFFT